MHKKILAFYKVMLYYTYILYIVNALKGTHHEKIPDYREPLCGEKRRRAFYVTSPLSILLNPYMSVDKDVFSTLQERLL